MSQINKLLSEKNKGFLLTGSSGSSTSLLMILDTNSPDRFLVLLEESHEGRALSGMICPGTLKRTADT